jgi:DNA modification methylase
MAQASTNPDDLIVDPFCGTREWGHDCGAMGRRYIGCDLAEGGSLKIVA